MPKRKPEKRAILDDGLNGFSYSQNTNKRRSGIGGGGGVKGERSGIGEELRGPLVM